jgi:hypothetical protein
MSDPIKAQNMPQFNWYTWWTSLGANGMPDKLIKEGLKQPNWIKVFFKKGTKEITGHVAPNQAWFGAEYFLAYTLPDFKSKILTQLSAEQKDNGPLLFSLIGQCFQDVDLTKWTIVILKWCPKDADRTKEKFDQYIMDYLEAIAGFPNIGNQLIHWLCTAKKPALMPMHEFMHCWVQLLSYLEGNYLRWTMDVPTMQEKSEQIFFAQLKTHQNKFGDLNKTVPANRLRMIAFFEQCQATDKAAGIFEKIAKDKKQPKEKSTTHVPTTRSHESSYKQPPLPQILQLPLKRPTWLQQLPTWLSSSRQSTPWSWSTRQQWRKEQQVLQIEGWSQARSLQEKEQQGHAQWPVLFVERRQFVQKKELILFQISFVLLLLFLLLLKQQELQNPSCQTTWSQVKRRPQTRVFVLQGQWWQTLPLPGQEQ